jgi:hypothetical protein
MPVQRSIPSASRERVAEALGRRSQPPTLAAEHLLPVPAAFRPLLPGSGLRRGSTVAVSRSGSLALALVAGASAAGSWVAAVGLPDLGVVAAAESGIALERLALVPHPGSRAWATVVAALLDAIDVVLVRPPTGLRTADARRLSARARERGAVLVPLGAWPEPADLRLSVAASQWQGLGQGHGRLESRWVEVVVGGRGAAARERRARLWLPSPAVTRGGPYVELAAPPGTQPLVAVPPAGPRAVPAAVPVPVPVAVPAVPAARSAGPPSSTVEADRGGAGRTYVRSM